MKTFIGTLAYVTASALVVLAVFFDVPIILSTVAVALLVLGALWAWSDRPVAQCLCPTCNVPVAKRATADDIR